MAIRRVERILSLLTGALFAEAVRLDPPEQRRSRRSRRIVKSAHSPTLADWFPAASGFGRPLAVALNRA